MPEYRLWGTVHQYFEHEHSIAYSNILVGLFDNNTSEIRRIFYLAKEHPTLKKRNELIANNYQKLFDIFWEGIKNVSFEDYARAVAYVFAGTYAMESITFYMGFRIIEFYQFKYGILPMTNKMISEIKADELFHVKVMATIINRLKPFITRYISREEFEDIVRNTLKAYYESDLEFYQDILQKNNFGITDKQIFDYITYLTKKRARLIGIDMDISDVKNPFEELDKLYGFIDSHDNSSRKDSIFESSSSAYVTQKIDDKILDEFEF
jgi:ribonucleotide reductase beta subunit family protein with ferritin-like domain